MPNCSQCGKPSVAEINGSPVCVDCFTKYQNAVTQAQMANLRHAAMLMPLVNYFDDQIWGVAGMRSPTRLELPPFFARMLATEGHVSNVFNISDAVIGNLNTGQQQILGNISVTVGRLEDGGHRDFSEALKAVAAAVASSAELAEESKTQVLEELEELGAQAVRPAEQRSKRAAIGAVLRSVATTLQAAGGLAEIWTTWGQALRGFFGF